MKCYRYLLLLSVCIDCTLNLTVKTISVGMGRLEVCPKTQKSVLNTAANYSCKKKGPKIECGTMDIAEVMALA